MKEDAYWVIEQVKEHNKWFEECIPMIASENLMSPLAKEMMISDFADRYAEGMPGKRYYRGNIYVDKVEIRCMELAQRIFKCKFADVRPISGTVANMAALFALTEPGDTITTASLDNGAHISTAKFGATGFRGVNTVTYPFNTKDMVIDIDGARKVIEQTRPKVAQFGMSLFLFPIPLKELKDTFEEVGCTVWYDAAHVLGLIAGGQFQDPLHEGANLISASTHKTFPGPNHGILLADNVTDEMEKRLNKAVFPGVTSSHHLHEMAALAVTLAEWEITVSSTPPRCARTPRPSARRCTSWASTCSASTRDSPRRTPSRSTSAPTAAATRHPRTWRRPTSSATRTCFPVTNPPSAPAAYAWEPRN